MVDTAFTSQKTAKLQGIARAPGDKSISHRALMLGGLAVGETRIHGLLEGEDVINTAHAMQKLGAKVERLADGSWQLYGRGVGGLCESTDILDMGNAGTGVRLLMGILATHPLTSFFTGDASLRRRPMRRVIEPLTLFGAEFHSREGGLLPLCLKGARNPLPVEYTLKVASAQVKSAVLLAGLNTPGNTVVTEPIKSRDHTELMLRHFGAHLRIEELPKGGRQITLEGQPELTGRHIVVPSDPSSAAFPLVAGLLVEEGEVILKEVGLNPLRTGLFTTLEEMGARIEYLNVREMAGEKIADIKVTPSQLKGVVVPSERAPSMIDEYPILAIAAACAKGVTRMCGLSELKVKESDRLTAIAEGLKACGVRVAIEGDDLIVDSQGRPPLGGAKIATQLDHRIAMSFLVMGMVSEQAVAIDDAAPIATSFPGFIEMMNGLGAKIDKESGLSA